MIKAQNPSQNPNSSIFNINSSSKTKIKIKMLMLDLGSEYFKGLKMFEINLNVAVLASKATPQCHLASPVTSAVA